MLISGAHVKGLCLHKRFTVNLECFIRVYIFMLIVLLDNLMVLILW